jgi:hypothetical protein
MIFKRKEGMVMEHFDMREFGDAQYLKAMRCAVLIKAPSEEFFIEAVKALTLPFSCILPCGNEYSVESIDDLPKADLPCPCGNPNHWFVKYQIDPSLG